MTIDTLAFVKHLESAGIDRKTAEAHAEAMAQHVFIQLATKADLEKVSLDLTKAMSDLALRLVLANVLIAGLAIAIAKAL